MDGADWIALYKFGRLALLAIALLGIAVAVWRRPALEDVAKRMLEDEES
ncbi:MAG TPA: hypothetical protein VMS55_00760 [Myxococcota bacterium]|nr:hypothetical protein [Myxococcota bacterium]